MQDMLDSSYFPPVLGVISDEPYVLAGRVLEAVTATGLPTLVFVDDRGKVYAHASPYGLSFPMDDVVGTYVPGALLDDVAADVRACVGPRLAAIGIAID
jgi:hypothetical protein